MRRRKVILKLIDFEYASNSVLYTFCRFEEISCLNSFFKNYLDKDYHIIFDIFGDMFFWFWRKSDEILNNICSKVWNALHHKRIDFDLLHHLDNNNIVNFFQWDYSFGLIFSIKVMKLLKKLTDLLLAVILMAKLMNSLQEIVN